MMILVIQACIGVLTMASFIDVILHGLKSNQKKFKSADISYLLVFLGLGLTLNQLSYVNVLLTTLAAVSLWINNRKSE